MIRKPSYDDAADPAKVAHLRIAVLGLGRAGQALAREFADAGLNLTGLWNRSPRSIHPALIGINVFVSDVGWHLVDATRYQGNGHGDDGEKRRAHKPAP